MREVSYHQVLPICSKGPTIAPGSIPKTGKDMASTPKIEIYTTPMCPFCWRAKRLLDGKNVDYTEIDLWVERARRQEMVERADGRTSVPQIFIDGKAIGGSDELVALEQTGRLDALLAEE